MTIYNNLTKSMLVVSAFVFFAGILPTSVSAHDVPTCTITAGAEQIIEGGSTTLSWSTTNSTSVSINNGVGTVNSYGVLSVKPTGNTTYTLTATNGTESVTCSATIKVLSSKAVPTCLFNATPNSISYGGSSTLEWDTFGADTVYINNGIGYVTAKDSLALTGFSSDVTYTLTATNGNGSKTCTARVDVKDSTTSGALSPTCQISATPESVSYNGSVILNWVSNGASLANISGGVGAVRKQGSKVVEHITDTTTFKLTVSGSGGSSSCSTTVYKDTVPAGPAPTCTIDIEPNSITYSGSTALSWKAYHSTYAQIDNNIGPVSATGSKLISPSKSTTYTMAVRDTFGRVGYCSKTLTVEGGNYYNGSSSYPRYGTSYPYSNISANTISLSSIPYTGVEDVLYTLAMSLLMVGSGFALYKLGREVVS